MGGYALNTIRYLGYRLRRIPLPRTWVNKGKKEDRGAATPRPSTTPFLALLHAEGLGLLRGQVGVVVHYLPSVHYSLVQEELVVVARVADETPLVEDIVSSFILVDHDAVSSPLPPRLYMPPTAAGRRRLPFGHGRHGANDHDHRHDDHEGEQQTKPPYH